MNGAAPVAPRITSAPMRSSTTSTGISHHLWLWRRKSISSANVPRDFISARRANSDELPLVFDSDIAGTPDNASELLEIPLGLGGGIVLDPVRLGLAVEGAAQRVLAQQPH